MQCIILDQNHVGFLVSQQAREKSIKSQCILYLESIILAPNVRLHSVTLSIMHLLDPPCVPRRVSRISFPYSTGNLSFTKHHFSNIHQPLFSINVTKFSTFYFYNPTFVKIELKSYISISKALSISLLHTFDFFL